VYLYRWQAGGLAARRQINMSVQKHEPRPAGRTSAAILAVACAAVLAAACSSGTGSQPGSAPVASLSGHAANSNATGPLTPAQSDQDMIHFARCMRSHGTFMSDPFHRPGHQGLSIDLPTQDAANRSAYNACTHFIQPIIQMKQAAGATRAAAQLPALTRYARCMRGHDISMLDPTPDGQVDMGNVPGISNGFGRYTPQFRAADGACRHLLPAGVHDDGTGP
jgi:hypothetical protein